MSNDNKKIGGRIKLARRGLGLRQHDVERLTGVKKDLVGKYERGICRIPADFINALAKNAGFDVSAIFEALDE